MKVLHMANTSFFLQKLMPGKLLELSKSCEIHVAAPYDPIYTLPYPFHNICFPRSINFQAFTALMQCVALLRSERFDIVHTHSSIPGFIGRLSCWLTSVRCVHTAHGLPFYDGQSRFNQLTYKRLELLASKWCDAILTQNSLDSDKLKGLGVITPIFYEGNDVDAMAIRELANCRGPVRDELGIAANDVLIGCFARFEPVKGWDTFIKAVEMLNATNVVVLACGENFNRCTEYSDRIHNALINSKAKFINLGFRDDVHRILSGCDIVALASEKEGMPRIIMEAMAAGLPVVATDAEGTRETCVNGVTALLSPVGDSEGLARNLRLLVSDKVLREKLGRAGQLRAQTEFNVKSVASRILSVYDGISPNKNS